MFDCTKTRGNEKLLLYLYRKYNVMFIACGIKIVYTSMLVFGNKY